MPYNMTHYEQVLFNLYVRYELPPNSNCNTWMAAIGMPKILQMSGGAAIALAQDNPSADKKSLAITAERVVYDLLRDIESISLWDAELSFSDNLSTHFEMLQENHMVNITLRHCRDERMRETAAKGVLLHVRPPRSLKEALAPLR